MISLKKKKIETKTERLNLRLTKEEKSRLDDLCEYNKLNMSDVIVALITNHHIKTFKS